MTLEAGKTYYQTTSFGDESITITLDNKTKFPDRSLNAIYYMLVGDHSELGRIDHLARLQTVSTYSSHEELKDKSKINYLQKTAIKSVLERGIKKEA